MSASDILEELKPLGSDSYKRVMFNHETEMIAVAGWATKGSLVSVKKDEQLDLAALQGLLERIERTIHAAPDHVRYQMNAFVIAVGSYVQPFTQTAIATAQRVGR